MIRGAGAWTRWLAGGEDPAPTYCRTCKRPLSERVVQPELIVRASTTQALLRVALTGDCPISWGVRVSPGWVLEPFPLILLGFELLAG